MKLLSRKYSLASVLTKVQVAFGIEDHHCDGTLNRGWIRRVVSSNLSLWNISMHKNDHFGKKHVWKPKCTNVVLFKPNYLVCFYKTLMKCLWHETECNGFERVCFLFILQKYSGLIPCCWLVVKWQFRPVQRTFIPMVLEPLVSAGGEWLSKLAPSALWHPPARTLSSQTWPGQSGLWNPLLSLVPSCCSLQLLLCFMSSLMKPEFGVTLRTFELFPHKHFKSLWNKIAGQLFWTNKTRLNKSRGRWPNQGLGIGQGVVWGCIGHHLFGVFLFHYYWFSFLFWPIKLENYFSSLLILCWGAKSSVVFGCCQVKPQH